MDEEIIRNLNDRLDRLVAKGRARIDEEKLRSQLNEGGEKMRRFIRKHPIGSVLTGLFTGFLISKIVSRSDH